MMPSALRRLAPIAVLAAALPLAACFTPTVKPKVSQAVLEARAHRNVTTGACEETPLSSISPLSVPFSFGEAALAEPGRAALDRGFEWLRCHPSVPVVVRGAADGHGTAADQQALANRRAAAAAEYLRSRGVTAAGLQQIGANEGAPSGEHLLVTAEGQRW